MGVSGMKTECDAAKQALMNSRANCMNIPCALSNKLCVLGSTLWFCYSDSVWKSWIISCFGEFLQIFNKFWHYDTGINCMCQQLTSKCYKPFHFTGINKVNQCYFSCHQCLICDINIFIILICPTPCCTCTSICPTKLSQPFYSAYIWWQFVSCCSVNVGSLSADIFACINIYII
jgi:hypothetical protein